jgi:uncharacterized protein
MLKSRGVFLMILTNLFVSSCWTQNDAGPGYRWELFRETPEWELAKAVRREDTSGIDQIIKQGGVNVNVKEPKFGQTLLILAIANDKLQSVDALLRAGADINIRNSHGNQAIHEACQFPNIRQHSAEMIRLLIKYGADVNSYAEGGIFPVPLAGASSCLACFKILLDHDANVYFFDKADSTFQPYPVWIAVLSGTYAGNFEVAKYMIIDKKMPIPNPLSYTHQHEPLDIFHYLNKPRFEKDAHVQKIKAEILSYLREIGFPRQGAYQH